MLVTGATGMVGSALCRSLLSLGASVTALVSDVDPTSEFYRGGLASQATVVNGRLEEYDAVERAVNEHETSVIFHLGAQTIVGTAHRAPLPTLATNVMGTAHVVETARRHRDLVSAVVIASSDKAYGEHTVLPYREDMPLAGQAPYEVSKSCADLIAQTYWNTYGVPVAIARCGNIYGPGDLNWSRVVPGTIRALLRQERPVLRSDGTFLRDYLFLDDVISGYFLLAEAVLAGSSLGMAFNLSPERPLTVFEIYRETCLATLGHEIEPQVLGDAKHEIHDQYLDASLARRVLGWCSTVSVQDGLARTVPWYREWLGVA
ncbi:MAG TPA: NAD-dependent epimerase/dehydratase family protein [Acidimicrobiia bacterium]|nr:NAD-dependent epimerase/dehydratase family protein [Acidimicrobiia bacterium]